MRRRAIALLVLTAMAASACGGASSTRPRLVRTLTSPQGQRVYEVRLPNGRVVEQAHSPTLAEPPKALLRATRPASTAGTVEQFDSVTVSTIPSTAHYVAGYVDGLFSQTYRQMLGRWPIVVGIAVRANDAANCFDMEPGNPPPSAAGPWAKMEFARGWSRPCEYSMLSWMGTIRANLQQWHIATCSSATQAHCVLLWDADWTYVRHLDSGFPCTQWTDHSLGRNLDESTCAAWFYRLTPSNPICYHRRLPRAECAVAQARVAKLREERRVVRWRRWWVGDHQRRAHCRRPYRRRACVRLGRQAAAFAFDDRWLTGQINQIIASH